MRVSQHAFRHARIHARQHHTHWDNHAGDSRYHKGFRGLYTPQALRAPVNSTRPLNFAKLDRTHLVTIHFKGAYSLPSLLEKAIQLPAPGPNTLCELAPIMVLHYLRVCVCVRL